MSELKSQITAEMKMAMRERDQDRLGTIRLILAAIKQIEVDERVELDDTRVLAVLDKMRKQRQDAMAQFSQAGRDDLAAKENAELAILQSFMPQALSAEEVQVCIQEAITATGAAGIRDMGKVMGVLKPKLQGRADMGEVSAKIKALLAE